MLAKVANADGIVTLKDYAVDTANSNATRMANYTYKTARMGNAKTGDVITGLMVTSTTANGKTSYSLKYTADTTPSAGSDWKTVPADAVTDANNNSVEVYLVYQQNDHITVHYVDGAGNELDDSETKYLSTLSDGLTISESTGDDGWAKDITNYTYDSAHLNSYLGDTVVAVKGVENSGSYKLQVKNQTSDTEFKDATATDLYLVYNKTNGKKVEVYYTDIAGVPIKDASGNPIVKTYDPSEWTGGTHNFIDDATGFTPEGYMPFSTATNTGDTSSNFNQDDYPHWWQELSTNGSGNIDKNNTGNRIVYVTDNYISNSNNNGTFGTESFRNVRGYAIDTMSYSASDSTLKIQRTASNNNNAVILSAPETSPYRVYIMYRPKLTIHDIDSQGRELGTRTIDNIGVGYDPQGWNNTYNATQLTANPSYGTRTSIYVMNGDNKISVESTHSGSTETNNFQIAWQFNGAASYSDINTGTRDTTYGTVKNESKGSVSNGRGKWITRIHTGSGTANEDYISVDGSLITDVYMQYGYTTPLTVTVHHVDENGKKLADDTTQDVTSGTALTVNSFQPKTNITNYNAGTIKYGSDFSTAQSFTNITFTKSGDSWQYAIDGGSAADITGNAEIYVVYSKKTDGRAVTIHFVDENGKELADPYDFTGFTVSSSGNTYKKQWDGGNMTGQSSITNSANYKSIPSGYSFIGEYLGPNFNTDTDKLVNSTISGKNAVQWYYDSTNPQWYTSHASEAKTSHQLTDNGVYKDYITDIYWVYTKKDSKNLTLHYIHPVYDDSGVVMDSDGNPKYSAFGSTAKYDDSTFQCTITYAQVQAAGDNGLQLTNGVGDDTTESDYLYSKDITEDGTTYNYYGTFLASPNSTDSTKALPSYARLTTDGPRIKRVRIHNGQYQFLVMSGDGFNRPLTQVRRNQWSYVTAGGRTYTLRKNGDNFVMLDSQVGRSSYDLSLTSMENSTDSNGKAITTNYYTATAGAEGTGLVYTIREIITNDGSAETTYDITVHEWTTVAQHDIWQLYTKHTDNPVVTISNEVVYSGNLAARITNLGTNKVVSYTWQKQINNGEWTEVVRTQNSSEWNIAHDLKDRSWLDLAADEGELSEDDNRNSVKYRVIVNYTDAGGNAQDPITSQEFTVPYWDQLENGGFETPAMTSSSGVNTQYSNAEYKAADGVWQTTGLGNDAIKSGTTGHDIEIVNTRNSDFRRSYGWKNGLTDGAKEGQQFAELNCENAGALYQDVVTHSNEYLNYWLSHRARGNDGARNDNTYYDTMYLVIMPTKLAMTSASDGGELKSQTDLETFINNHAEGGYVTSAIKEEENKIVCQDMNSGVLIVRITSDNLDWHSINVSNGYLATSNLTRFFFVAGTSDYSTTHNYTSGSEQGKPNKTVGNFLDAVGFSQHLQTPETPHYHMVVKKTFSGLTASDVAKLASNKSGTTFKIKIDEYLKDSKDTTGKTYNLRDAAHDNDYYYEKDVNSSDKYDTLNGAELGFTVDNSGNFTLTATGLNPDSPSGKRVNLLTSGSTGAISEDADTGNITMTWTLANNYFGRGIDTDVREKYFKVTESGTDLDGYSVATTNDGTIEDTTTNDGTATTTTTNLYQDDSGNAASQSGDVTKIFTVKDRTTARINYNNTYRNNTENEPEQMTVQKKFTGITPSTVSSMMGSTNPYQITVTKNGGQSITLVGNTDRPVSGSYPTGVEWVTLTTSADPTTGVSTFTWTIRGTQGGTWIASGDYTVTESNYEPTGYPVTKITLNGKEIEEKEIDNKVIWPTAEQKVVIGENADLPTIQVKTESNVITSNLPTSSSPATVDSDTNLIVAKYTHGSAGGATVSYVVWTPNVLGLNEKRAIINYLKNVTELGASSAGARAFEFRTGANPGNMTVGDSEMTGTFYYDGSGHQISFTDNSTNNGTKWKSYFATNYRLGKDTAQNATEIRITNSYQPSVRVLKVDGKDNTTVLKGAEFKLFKLNETTRQYLKVNGSALSWDSSSDDDAVLTTNAEGIAEHKSGANALEIISQLQPGTYYIEENKAPDGYNMPTKPVVAFKVDSEGIVSKAAAGDIDDSVRGDIDQARLVEVDWNSPYYTIHITNTSGFALPETGGRGTLIFTILGLLLLFGGGTGLYLRRKRLKSTF